MSTKDKGDDGEKGSPQNSVVYDEQPSDVHAIPKPPPGVAEIATPGSSERWLRRGLRDPRKPRGARTLLDEPRKPANRDWLAVERRRLWRLENPAGGGATSPYFMFNPNEPSSVPLTAKFVVPVDPSGSRKPVSVPDGVRPPVTREAREADEQARLTMLMYRYTKQAEIVNDDMGYGERMIEPFFRRKAGSPDTLERILRVSQRTKTGRQQLFIGNSKLEPLYDDEPESDFSAAEDDET